ncbi:hypothetical protein CKJ90_29125, partial [Klebsiella pneumoniae]
GSHQGETPGIFIVLSGFAATDLSVRFRDARQGGGAYGKTRCAAFPFPHHETARFSRAFTRMLLPLAAAERQERSD